MTEEMSKKVIEFTQNYYKWSLRVDDDFCIERFVDDSDEFPKSDIRKILQSDKPLETFDEIVMDWDIHCDDWYYEEDFWKKIREFCEENNIDEDEARDIVYDNFYWAYPDSFLNPDVSTMWVINHGDMNHDWTKHNVLNYAADYGYCNGLEKSAGLYWLAKQQNHLTELQNAIKGKSPKIFFTSSELIEKLRKEISRRKNGHYYNATYYAREMVKLEKATNQINFIEWIKNRDGEDDLYVRTQLTELCQEYDIKIFKYDRSNFVETCITELENCSHYMTALQFMVKMPLKQIIEIKQKIADMENDKDFDKYNPTECKKDYGYIVLDKSTYCGLFETWGDGGSLMEIELEKDVKLPLKYLWNIIDNKGYQDCCSVVESCWRETIKEINLKEIA